MASKTASLARWKASNGKIVGARVIDLNCLSQGIQEVSKHNTKVMANVQLPGKYKGRVLHQSWKWLVINV